MLGYIPSLLSSRHGITEPSAAPSPVKIRKNHLPKDRGEGSQTNCQCSARFCILAIIHLTRISKLEKKTVQGILQYRLKNNLQRGEK